MRIINDPTKEQLDKLQSKLSREGNVGVIDIYGGMVQGYCALESDGDLIGIASISPFGDEAVEIFKLYIDPEHRGTGLGVYLVTETISFLASNGFKEILIETTPESSGFWEKIKSTYSTTQYDYNKLGINVSS